MVVFKGGFRGGLAPNRIPGDIPGKVKKHDTKNGLCLVGNRCGL